MPNLTKLQRALLIIGFLWLLIAAWITWNSFHRTLVLCFNGCGEPIDQPFELSWLLAHLAGPTILAAIAATIAAIWLGHRDTKTPS